MIDPLTVRRDWRGENLHRTASNFVSENLCPGAVVSICVSTIAPYLDIVLLFVPFLGFLWSTNRYIHAWSVAGLLVKWQVNRRNPALLYPLIVVWGAAGWYEWLEVLWMQGRKSISVRLDHQHLHEHKVYDMGWLEFIPKPLCGLSKPFHCTLFVGFGGESITPQKQSRLGFRGVWRRSNS